MNRTKIEWTDFSWNPVTGCSHGCWYCYAKKLTERFRNNFPNGFEPTFYPERLEEPSKHKKSSKIFVCSIADLFAEWTPTDWRDQVLQAIECCPTKHTFQLLTKNPERIPKRHYPDNVWIGTTVTGEDGDIRNIEAIKQIDAKVKFVSFEPLLGYIPPGLLGEDVDWVIVGKLTGSKRVSLNWKVVQSILDETEKVGVPIFMKNNLGIENLIQEFPEGGKPNG